MAEGIVCGALLSASFQVLFSKLLSREFISFVSKRKCDDGLIDKLKTNFLALQAVLDDAEDKQITNQHVKAWLDELQHVVYQADDLLDEIATKALRVKLEADYDQSQSQSSTTQVGFTRFLRLIKNSLLRINKFVVSNSVYLSDEEIESRMKEIISKLEYFVEQKKTLQLREFVGRKPSQRLPTASLVYEDEVCGRKDDREKIIKLLLSGNAVENEMCVIPIVGMGGVGKTTLAQLVYNDARVNEHFHMKSWVCVSDAFDISMITKKILDGVTSSNNNINDLDDLQIKLKESLAGKRFLIVLDDVWNDNYIDWDLLRRPFRAGAQESRIIVTTRNDNVASMMGTITSHPVEQLPIEDCWSLFAKHAFVNGDYMAYPELQSIGREIVKKCGGLPLAVKSLGGLLRSKLEIEEWKNILKSEIWDLDQNIPPALKLSYHYLPPHLKRCFAYCSIFPKDYKFEKEKLVQLWIALDLVQQPKTNKSMEDEGNDYFRELLSRSFFQIFSHDNDSDFLMHDLIHNLAQVISGEFCFRLDKPLDYICEKVCHFSYVRGNYDASEKFKAVNEVKCLRTFISFSRDQRRCYLGNKVLHDMLPILRCLRVLSLSNYHISELPQSIENLIHLRYLDLSKTRIKKLPDSVTTLCNLQILDLSYCECLTELPENMGKLTNLRHLDIKGTRLTEMPTQMSRLKDLQHLTYFVVGTNVESSISGLKELCHLRGNLDILGLENVVSGQDASEANMKEKKNLEGLVLKWGGDTDDSIKERDVLDKLQPHEGLKTLSIFNYGSTKFPEWLEGAHSLHNMVSLELISCANCYSLPSIGQLPSLKDLRIRGMKAITKVGGEFYRDASSSIKPFQSLETLSFERMPEWKEWHALGAGEFSRLLKLRMFNCPKLTGELPNHFPSLRKLEIFGCHGLVSSQIGFLLQGLPYLQELKMSDMTNLTKLPQQLQHLSSLQELVISNMPNLMELPLQLQHLSSLQELMVSNMPNLKKLPQQLQYLSSLRKLKISRMPNLKELPLGLCRLIKLERLNIEKCRSLVSFPDVGLLPMLKALEIDECEALQSLTIASAKRMNVNMMDINNICLEELRISHCSSLLQLFFPNGGLPPLTLKELEINNCRSLEFPLPKEMKHNYHTCSIKVLKINDCDLLKSLWLGFSPRLRSLKIRGCINFEKLSIPDNELQNLMELRIENCPTMVSFAHGGLPAPNLTSFTISNCKKLKSLPQRMHTFLPSLQSLRIQNCPEVESFPDGGLPSNLTTLCILYCEKLMKGRMGWGLQSLSSLRNIWFLGGKYEEEALESFPEELLLPTTLTYLCICDLPNLKSLNNKGIQCLTSLEILRIHHCLKLHSLPAEGLPNSLSYLWISKCPLLKLRCQRETGEDWPKICQIRHIELDGEDIVNLE
ncbi:putative disease resistance RPP13-like protein 1 [Cornus florida]|uniref:putative disease resistance RPP13-like protein 1 n=1 Tax=Cornus florida TaxID=4283 RepID=UPI0028A2B8DE|nr:putative disease resistance RPP13-like protein 1 [Cornus florida]